MPARGEDRRDRIAGFRPALALAVALAGDVPAIAQHTVPAGFALHNVVLDPFDSPPIAFAFLPDGRILVIEKDAARVRLATPFAQTSVVIATLPNVTIDLERGLLGVAVDPAWPARPYVYFHSTRAGSTIHITLYRAQGDLTDPSSTNLVLVDPYTLLDDIPDLAATHNGGTLRFGPDGFLYVSLGEDVRACEAQNLAQPHGKILRLDVSGMPGEGTGPPAKAALAAAGNPIPGGDWSQLVWAWGLRNPFRFTIDAATGDLWIGDVGHVTWEEVDHLVRAGFTGANYGWPEFEATLQDPIPSAADCSTPPFVGPVYQYPNPPGAPVVSVIGGPLYRGDPHAPYAFPSAYDGDLFIADFYGGWIRRLRDTGAAFALADSVAGQPAADRWAAGLGQVVDLQQGPDGALYFMSFIHGGVPRGVHRIVSTLPSDVGGGETASVLRIAPNPSRAGTPVFFASSARGTRIAQVRIVDVAGRVVRALSVQAAPPLAWDGRDSAGRDAPAGVYAVEMRLATGARARRTLVRLP